MADVRPFRAFRYDLGRIGALGDVVAPPYDVIDPALQHALYDRSPYNAVRLLLNKEVPGDSEADNRYTRAARFLHDWQADDVLVRDSAPSFYAYRQDFEIEGRKYTRKGFFARVRLEPFGAGRIFAHEETMPGPKADRLKLFHATAMNLCPIFGLYPDPDGEVMALLDAAVGRRPPLEATDHLGVISRLWPVTDQHVQSAVTGLLSPKPLFIADGHHRYETALRYLEQRRAAGAARDDDPAEFILMALVSMSDPGLIVLPTHRIVGGFPALGADGLAEVLRDLFTVEKIGVGEAAAREAWERIEMDGGQDLLGFCTTDDGVWQTARFTTPPAMAQLAAAHSPLWRSLAVSILQVLVLDRLLPAAVGGKAQCGYVHLLREASDAAAARQGRLIALVPPATMGHVEQIAGGLEKMPAKSTYFYPKLLSGLVFNPLKGS
jgi:uncharacterized protein (DUF1015 family)